jgi:hypothetical protein
MGLPMRTLISLLLVSLLSACGGGGGGGPSPALSVGAAPSNCTLKTYSATYPSSYSGSNSIPTPTQKFDNTVMRSIGLKDYYPVTNDCASPADSARVSYSKTLDRLQTLGVDVVEIYQYGPVTDFNDSVWTTNESSWQIPKSELIWFVKEAHSRNIKVTLVWQLWPNDSKGNILNATNPSETEMLKVLHGWHNVITDMAKFSGSNNVDNLYIQWSAFYYPVVTTYTESATQEFLSIIADIRSVFNGKLFMGTPRFYDKRIIEKVDAIVVPVSPSNWSYNDDLNISVSLLKQRYSDAITGAYLEYSLYTGMDPKNIPIIWDFNIQSRDKALSQGWVEDGFCVASCIQNTYTTDFSVQALAIEGAFEAIREQTYFKTYGINFSTGYWHTDTLVPGPEGFPNLSQSIRGKPAENIVKQWFKKG